MCGIVAFSSFGNKKINNALKLKTLMFYNEERGKDSAGFFTPESGVIKKKGKPRELLISPDFKIPESNNLFLGHVRASTVGINNDENAHPFNYGNIVLVMNGTLKNHWTLLRKYELEYSEFNVDSQVLCGILNKQQNKDVLSEIDGSCATIYTDTSTNTLYIYRNSERPLFKGIVPDEGVYYSSIKESLELINCINVKEVKEDNLYVIKNGIVDKTIKIKRYIAPVTTPVTTYNNYGSEYITELNKKQFINRYITVWSSSANMQSLLKDVYYQIVEPTDQDNELSNEITVYDHINNKRVTQRVHLFEQNLCNHAIGDSFISKRSIWFVNTNEKFADKDDILVLQSRINESFIFKHKYKTYNKTVLLKKDEIYSFVKPLTKGEELLLSVNSTLVEAKKDVDEPEDEFEMAKELIPEDYLCFVVDKLEEYSEALKSSLSMFDTELLEEVSEKITKLSDYSYKYAETMDIEEEEEVEND